MSIDPFYVFQHDMDCVYLEYFCYVPRRFFAIFFLVLLGTPFGKSNFGRGLLCVDGSFGQSYFSGLDWLIMVPLDSIFNILK